MEELKLSPRKIVRVWVGDVSYDVKKPTNGDVYEMHKAQKDVEDIQKIHLVVDLLDRLGLPKDVYWSLDPQSSAQIVEALIPTQKKTS